MLRPLIVGGLFVIASVTLGAQPAEKATVEKNDYSKAESWLCRPDKSGDACSVDLTTTVVAPDGKLTRESYTPNPKAPIDCFYVYPTVSTDQSPNSDMTAIAITAAASIALSEKIPMAKVPCLGNGSDRLKRAGRTCWVRPA